MKRYKNLSNQSGAIAYEIGNENIKVQFRDGSIYNYTYASSGKKHIEKMKVLAEQGRGLTTYINVYVREKYEMKII